MPFIKFSDQEKEQANATDIASYLRMQGEDVKRVGREQVWQSPGGKVSINGSEWYSHYEQTGGGAVLFVRKFFGKSFPDAIRELLGRSAGTEIVRTESHERKQKVLQEFIPPQTNSDMRRAYGYLVNERCIDRNVIHAFAHKGLLYEEPEHHNVVFIGQDMDGIPRHAQKRSTNPNSDFKNNVAGSNADYSFHWDGTSESLYVFEAPIDLLAYITMHQECWKEHSYVALCSTADRAMIRMLEDHLQLKNVYLCLDHDSAGIEGAYRLAESIRNLGEGYTIWRAMPTNKDWDEDLKAQCGREPIPAGKHRKLSAYEDICVEVSAEIADEIERTKIGDNAKRYRKDRLIPFARSIQASAESTESEEQRIGFYKRLGVILAVSCYVDDKNQTADSLLKSIRGHYKPHKDYDSPEAIGEKIQERLRDMQQYLLRTDTFSQTELQGLHESLLSIASECFRMCSNLILSEENEIQTNELTL